MRQETLTQNPLESGTEIQVTKLIIFGGPMYYPDRIVLKKGDAPTNPLLGKLPSLFSNYSDNTHIPTKKAPTRSLDIKSPDEICSCGCSTKKANSGCSPCSETKATFPDTLSFPRSSNAPVQTILPDTPLSRVNTISYDSGIDTSKQRKQLIYDRTALEEPPNFSGKDRGKPYYPKTNSIYSFYEPRTFFSPTSRISYTPEPIGYFLDPIQSSPVNLQIPALYGRSVGSFGSGPPGGGCSAWLTGGPYLFSASHFACGAPFTKNITLGMYGTNWQENDFFRYYEEGQNNALGRLTDLGFNINNISINGRKLLPLQPIKTGTYGLGVDDTLQVFQAQFKDISTNPLIDGRDDKKNLRDTLWHKYGSQSGPRDVSYWSTTPKLVEYSPIKGKKEYTFIYPSHIYGHTYITTFKNPFNPTPPSAPYKDPKNYDTWDLPSSWSKEYFKHVAFSSTQSFETRKGNPNRRYAYISPKALPSGRNGQPFLYERPSGTAGLSVDYRGLYVPDGSSGGYLSNSSSSRAIGISTLYTNIPSCINVGPFQPSLCSSGFSLLPPEALFYTHESLRNTIPLNKNIPQTHGIVSRSVGGKGGNKKTYNCPPGFAVAGFVGSSVSGNSGKEPDRVGHLGMVCLPFPTKPYDLLVNAYLNGFSQAKVFGGSSIDTSVRDSNGRLYLSGIDGMELNQYLNEYLSTTTPQPIVQYIQKNLAVRMPGTPPYMNLCAPGYFVSKLYLSSRQYRDLNLVESVFAMRCQHWEDGQGYFRLFNNFIGNPNPTNLQVLEANNNSIVTGMNISSGWYTDNLSLIFSKGV